MSNSEAVLREALAKIAQIAGTAARDNYAGSNYEPGTLHGNRAGEMPSCTVKPLPKRLLHKAAQTARMINPVNAPLALGGMGMPLDPMRISVLTSKYWGPIPRKLTVSFMETTPSDLRARILQHMNAWTQTSCISFVETQQIGQVRISRGGGGYWSYLGTDILHIPTNRQTMNLENFTMMTDESGISAWFATRLAIRSALHTSICARTWWPESTRRRRTPIFCVPRDGARRRWTSKCSRLLMSKA